MKTAIIGSRNLKISNLEDYIPKETTTIVSGGAKGVDSDASIYAKKKGIDLVEFFPQYSIYRKAAPLKRNDEIINYADHVIAFWDGKSKGTKYVIDKCNKLGKSITVYLLNT